MAGCNGAPPLRGGVFALERQQNSLVVHIVPGAAYQTQFLRVADWEQAQGSLSNPDPALSSQAVTALASIDPATHARTATLTFSNLASGSGYTLTLHFLKKDASGNLQTVASRVQGGISIQPGSNVVPLGGAPEGLTTAPLAPPEVAGSYVTSLPRQGVTANLINAQDSVRDSHGRYFILDNGRLRMALPDALGRLSILSIAGVDNSGVGQTYGFRDGTGSQARFDDPLCLAIDASDVLYVADSGNNAIRRVTVDSTGAATVTTLAGDGNAGYLDGPGKHAEFNDPTGVAVDPTGRVYVADKQNCRIRKLTPDATGAFIVGTVAGNGTAGCVDGAALNAQFNHPTSLDCAPNGGLYVGDDGNNRVRLISDPANDASVSTVAGNGVYGFEDGLPSSAEFDGILGLRVAPDGVIYVLDGRVRKISPDLSGHPMVSTLAGGGPTLYADSSGALAGFLQFHGLALEASGKLLVTESKDLREVAADASGAVSVTKVLGQWSNVAAPFNSSDGMAVDGSNLVPRGVAADTKNHLFVTSNNQIFELDAANPDSPPVAIAGQELAGDHDGPASSALFNVLDGIVSAPDGSLFVADTNSSSIRKLQQDASGAWTVQTVLGLAAAPTHFAPSGLALDAAGNFYISDANNNCIQKLRFDAHGQPTVSLLGGAAFSLPHGLSLDQSGDLLIADTGNGCVKKMTFDAQGGATISTVAGPADGLSVPMDVRVDAAGNLLVSDLYQIKKITFDAAGHPAVSVLVGADYGFADGLGTAARFASIGGPYLQGLALDSQGALYVADPANLLIRKISR